MKVGFHVNKPLMPGDYILNVKASDERFVIKDVIFNDPATIVFWANGDKTVVKCHNEDFDPEKGLAMAISKRALGDEDNYYKQFRKWLPESEELDEDEVELDIPPEDTGKRNLFDSMWNEFKNNLKETFGEGKNHEQPTE